MSYCSSSPILAVALCLCAFAHRHRFDNVDQILLHNMDLDTDINATDAKYAHTHTTNAKSDGETEMQRIEYKVFKNTEIYNELKEAHENLKGRAFENAAWAIWEKFKNTKQQQLAETFGSSKSRVPLQGYGGFREYLVDGEPHFDAHLFVKGEYISSTDGAIHNEKTKTITCLSDWAPSATFVTKK